MKGLIEFYNDYDNCNRYFQRTVVNCGSRPEFGYKLIKDTIWQHRRSFKGQTLVDLGCGPCSSILMLTKFEFGKYIGLDSSEIMLKMASRVAKKEKINFTSFSN